MMHNKQSRVVFVMMMIVALVLAAVPVTPAYAATITWTGATSTAWTTGSNWSGGVVPGASDDVIIPNVTNDPVISAGNVTVASITINNGGVLTVNSTTDRTITVSGDVVINAGGTFQVANPIGINTHTLNVGGNFTNSGTFTAINASDTINVTFNGGAAQTLGGSTTTTFNNVTVNKTSGTLTLGVNTSIVGNLTVSAGTLDMATFAANRSAAGGTLTVSNSTTLRIGGTNTLPSNYSTHSIGATSTIEYYGTAQTVAILNSAQNYGNLTISGSGNKTLAGSITVAGTFNLSAGTLVVGTNTLTLNSTVTCGGGSITSSATGTVSYAQGSNGQNVCAGTYGNLTFSNFNKILASTGTIGIAGTFTPGTATGHTITGSTIDFNGTGAQTIPAFNYNNLTSSSTGARTLASSGTVGVAGTFAPGTNTYTITGSTIDFNGASVQTIPAFSYNNLTFSGAGTKTTAAGTLTIGGNWSVGSTTALSTNNSVINLTGNLSGAGNITQGTGAISIGGNCINNGTFTAGSGGVTYNGSGAQTVCAWTYQNLILSGSSAKTVATGTSVAGNLSIAPSGTATASINNGLNIPVGSLTLGGLGRINGTWGSTTSPATNTNNTYFAATTGIVTVSTDTRATPTVTAWPTASGITYGQALSTSTLTGGTASVPGSFAFTTPSTVPPVGTFSAPVTFSPTDLTSYTTVVDNVDVAVAPKALTVSGITADDKVYDGTATATLDTSGATLVGVEVGDDVTLDSSGAAGAFSDANVGTAKTISISGLTLAGADAGNYTLTQPTTTADITAKELMVTGITADDKVYDGTATATLDTSGAALVGVEVGDDVTLDSSGAAGAFSDADVGTGKTVTISSLTLGGADAGNYTLTQPTTTADITAKELTVTGITADDKVYDGTATATLDTSLATLVGVESGDVVTLDSSGAAGAFSDANVGTAKTVTISGLTLGGADAGNYTLTQPTTTADITAKELTVTGITADDKVYDGNTTVTLDTSLATLVGVESGDVVTLDVSGATGAFSDADVGTGKTVTISGLTISGADAGNYTLTQPTTTADITAKELTVTGITADDKVYDGNTTATLDTSGAALVGVVGGDDVTLDASGAAGTFSDADVGTGKTVTISGLTLGGADAGNYTLTQPTTTADITPKELTVDGITADDKVYDGTATATLDTSGATLVGVVGSEDVTLDTSGAAGAFSDANVGTGKTVTISGLTLGGVDAGNYTLTQPTTTADITAKELTVTGITADDRIYDGTAIDTLDFSGASLQGVVGLDDVSLDSSGYTATFDNKNVGTSKPVTVSGVALSGADAGNYTLSQPTGLTADITPKALTVSGITADDKVYDGNTTATLDTSGAALVGVVGSEDVTLDTSGAAGAFSDANVGTGKTVTISGLTIGGVDAGNYTLTQPTTTADIAPLAITVTADNGQSKVYGAADPTFTYTHDPLLGSDVFTGALSRVAGENVGTYAITQGTLSAGPNYTINFTPANFTITPANSTTSLASSANPSVVGSSVTFTATVAPSAATGTVQFYADGVALGSAATLSGGTASVGTAALSMGTHVITATYSGDSNLNASTSAPLVQTVSSAYDIYLPVILR